MTAEFLDWLLRGSLLLSLALAVVWMLRAPVRRLFGARIGYLLWMLAPVAIAAPLLPSLPGGPNGMGAMLPALPVPAAAGATPSLTGSTGGGLLLAWGLGALVFALLQLRAQRRFRRRLGALVPRGDGTWRAAGASGPLVFGVLRPRIVVPADFCGLLDAEQQRLVIAHERAHLARADLPAAAIASAIRCLHWFNPLVHLALSRFRLDQEMACDAAVLAREPGARAGYARALLDVQLGGPEVPLGCAWRSGHPLKERLMMLRYTTPSAARQRLGLALVVALCATAGLAMAGNSPPASNGLANSTDVSFADMTPPRYPADALRARLSGKVVLRVLVGSDGLAQKVELESATAPGVFDEAAMAAVKGWRFNPATRDGEPTSGWVLVPVSFDLDESPEPSTPDPASADIANP